MSGLTNADLLKRARAIPATSFVKDPEAARILDALTRAIGLLADVIPNAYAADKSVALRGRFFELVNDLALPAHDHMYATDSHGIRGWRKTPDGFPGRQDSIVIDPQSKKIKLDGDREIVVDDRYYGAQQGVRGWYDSDDLRFPWEKLQFGWRYSAGSVVNGTIDIMPGEVIKLDLQPAILPASPDTFKTITIESAPTYIWVEAARDWSYMAINSGTTKPVTDAGLVKVWLYMFQRFSTTTLPVLLHVGHMGNVDVTAYGD